MVEISRSDWLLLTNQVRELRLVVFGSEDLQIEGLGTKLKSARETLKEIENERAKQKNLLIGVGVGLGLNALASGATLITFIRVLTGGIP